MRATEAWQRLLREIEEHTKNVQSALAVHTSTCCQPGKAPALVPSLEEAGLRDARATASGAWTVSLHLPALYTPGDRAAFHVTAQGLTKKAAVQDLQVFQKYH